MVVALSWRVDFMPPPARSGTADAPGIGAPDPRFGGSAGTPPLVERVSLFSNAFLVRLSHGNTEREGCRPHEPRLAAGPAATTFHAFRVRCFRSSRLAALLSRTCPL